MEGLDTCVVTYLLISSTQHDNKTRCLLLSLNQSIMYKTC